MNNVVKFITKEEKEFKYIWDNSTYENRLFALATYILKYNDRVLAEKVCGTSLNDLEFQQFKRVLKKYI